MLAGTRPDVVFLVNGGVRWPSLEEAASGLANVRFGEFQPAERLADVLATGDIHLVPLKKGLAKASVPSKLYSILAAGRLVFVSKVDEGTEVARTVRPPAPASPCPRRRRCLLRRAGAAARRPRRGLGDGGAGPPVRGGLGIARRRRRALRGLFEKLAAFRSGSGGR